MMANIDRVTQTGMSPREPGRPAHLIRLETLLSEACDIADAHDMSFAAIKISEAVLIVRDN